MTDASDKAVGAVLQQYVDDAWHPIAYFSRKLKPAETRYSAFDKELLAIYLAIKHFRHFVEGRILHSNGSQALDLRFDFTLLESFSTSSSSVRLHCTVHFGYSAC